jgi:hypothetical protein
VARAPLSPKFHGAWLGAGTGQEVANVIVGILQDYVTHAPLTASATQGIYILVSAALAGLGAYILPPGPTSEMTPRRTKFALGGQISPTPERLVTPGEVRVLGGQGGTPAPPPEQAGP